MTNISKYTVKKGFYREVEDVDIYIPSSSIFIKDNTNCGDGLHDGHYHFLGIAPYKEFQDFIDFIDEDDDAPDYIDCHYGLGKEWVLFEVKNVDDKGQFNVVSVEEFNKICDFKKYCIAAWKEGEVKSLRKIKYINSIYDIEVIDADPHSIITCNIELSDLYFLYKRDYYVVSSKNNIINMYWKQMVYNALTSMGIPCYKSYDNNINMGAAVMLYSDMLNFNCDDRDLLTFHRLINFKEYKKLY